MAASAAAAREVVRVLSRHVLPARLQRVRAQLRFRVADTALVLENVSDALNAAACLRTADALGIHRVLLVNKYVSAKLLAPGQTGVDRGALKWLSVTHHEHAQACVDALRAEGFLIAATDLGAGALDAATAAKQTLAMAPPSSMPSPLTPEMRTSRPRCAVVLGNESRGVSRLMLGTADVRFFLPQAGFVQSFNVSVACGLALSAFLHRTPDFASHALAAHRARAADGAGPAPVAAAPAGGGGVEVMSDDEAECVLARTLLRDVPSAAAILDRAGIRPLDY